MFWMSLTFEEIEVLVFYTTGYGIISEAQLLKVVIQDIGAIETKVLQCAGPVRWIIQGQT